MVYENFDRAESRLFFWGGGGGSGRMIRILVSEMSDVFFSVSAMSPPNRDGFLECLR